MDVPKKARMGTRGVTTKKAVVTKTTQVSIASMKPTQRKTPTKKSAKKTPATKVSLPIKATAKRTAKTKDVATVTINAEKIVKAVTKKTALKKATLPTPAKADQKNSPAYKKKAMKMAAQIVKGTGKKARERERTLEALLKRNGIAEAPKEVSIETSYRVGESDEGATLFSRVKTGQAVILTARVFGLSFVVLGAFFTLLTINRVVITNPDSVLGRVDNHLASLLSSTSGGTLNPTSSGTITNTTNTSNTTQTAAPQVNFMLPSGSITGNATLKFSVPAEGVLVSVYHRQTQQLYKLGTAQTSDKMLWSYDWDTSNYLPGDYAVQVVIKDSSGTYTQKSSQLVTVLHQVLDDTTNTSSSTTATTQTTTSSSFSDIDFTLIDKIPSPLIDTRSFEFSALGVDSLTFEAIHSDTKARISLGAASAVDVDTWRMTIDTALLENARYLLRINARTNAGIMVSGTPLSFTVDKTATPSVASSTSVSSSSTPSTGSTTQSTLKNRAVVKIDSISPVSGSAQLFADTDGAAMAEFYVRPSQSLKDIFIGKGARVSATTWRLSWDTRQTPNGTYNIFSRHQNEFGYYSSQPILVEVKNTVASSLTAEQQAALEAMKDISSVAPSTPELIKTTLIDPIAQTATTSDDDIDSESDSEENATEQEPERVLKNIYERFEGDIDGLLEEYTRKLRDGDEAGIAEVQRRIEVLTGDMSNSLIGSDEVGDPVAIKKRIEDDLTALTQEVRRTQEIVKARVGDAVTKDSDKDSITDYDELTFYKTDPFSADSDGDGFNDDAEIVSGFDPTDTKREVAIQYESPKEAGVVREDLLEVSGIASEPAEEENGENQEAAAIITGKALPNSFVTIYIFSTPVIVTVKTNDDGSWSYRFDKELEDGEHEVFVGVTDNAGKIVAKSNPFTFVKEAQAFTPVDAETALVSTSGERGPSFFSQQALIIAMAGVVIALGLILLMISVYIMRRPRSDVVSADTAHGT